MQPRTSSNLNISNAFSALRAVMAIPAAYFIAIGRSDITVWLCLGAAATDILDGYLARKLNQVTELGKVIDPIADKIYVAGLVLTMIIHGPLPLWFAAAVLGRDAIIFCGGLYIKSKYGIVLMSNYVGKATVVVLCLTLLWVLIWNQWTENMLVNIFFWGSLVMMAASLVVYAKRAVDVARSGAELPRPSGRG